MSDQARLQLALTEAGLVLVLSAEGQQLAALLPLAEAIVVRDVLAAYVATETGYADHGGRTVEVTGAGREHLAQRRGGL